MTYALSAPLQAAVFSRLSGDATLGDLVGSAIFDAPPEGQLPALYVTLGPEEVRSRADKTGRAAQHRFTVTVVTRGGGFQAAKDAAQAVEAALTDAPLTLSRGRLMALQFDRARAERDRNGTRRRIEMRFRALVDDTLQVSE